MGSAAGEAAGRSLDRRREDKSSRRSDDRRDSRARSSEKVRLGGVGAVTALQWSMCGELGVSPFCPELSVPTALWRVPPLRLQRHRRSRKSEDESSESDRERSEHRSKKRCVKETREEYVWAS